MIRISLFLVVICFGCQTGRIPCPKPNGSKVLKSSHQKKSRSYSVGLTADAREKGLATREKTIKSLETRYEDDISLEEWDCPQPGSRKYLPKNVKENIRRNTKRIQEDSDNAPSDSLSIAN